METLIVTFDRNGNEIKIGSRIKALDWNIHRSTVTKIYEYENEFESGIAVMIKDGRCISVKEVEVI